MTQHQSEGQRTKGEKPNANRQSPITKSTRLLFAFLNRDLAHETSYRLAFLGTFANVFVRVLLFYFLSKFISTAATPYLGAYQGNYFAFVLIGITLGSYFSTGLSGFAHALREAQTTGTLEALLMTPAPLSIIIIGSALWSYAFTTIRVLAYLILGALLGMSFNQANFGAALVILTLAIIAFASIGILAAAIIMVIKRGDPVTGLLANAANLVGGVFYPVEVLPDWLQWLAKVLPLPYALHALRLALLNGAEWQTLWPDIAALLFFCLIGLPVSLLAFRSAIHYAKRDGSLTHY
ncbi:MAG: ABC transporter permease [Candidatus Promineifilaceae bacterium]